MSEPVVIWINRDTGITVRLGEAQPTGSTFAAEVRESDDPTSTLLARWSIDDTNAETTGVLTLTVTPADIETPLASRRGVMDIVRTVGTSDVPVFGPRAVVFKYGPTVPA